MKRQQMNNNKNMCSPPILQLDRRHEILSEHKNCRHHENEKLKNTNFGIGEQATNFCCTNELKFISSNNKNNIDFLLSSAELSHIDQTVQYEDDSAGDNKRLANNSKNVYGKLRKTTSLDNSLTNFREANIYENLCQNRCDSTRKDISNAKRGIFRFLGNFKRKTSVPTCKEPTKRLEIIHNVTGVFKTQESFDLREICQMRDEDNILRKVNNAHNCTVLSDTYRKFHVYEDENIYENLDFMKSSLDSDDNGFNIPVNIQDWRKRLRSEIYDYNESDFFYLKSIPSHHQKFMYDENIVFLRNDKQTINHDESVSSVFKLSTSVKLDDNRRRCYYQQDQQTTVGVWKPTEISIILHSTSKRRDNENSDFVEGLLKLFDAYLIKSHMSDQFECVIQSHEKTSHEITSKANVEIQSVENVTENVPKPLTDSETKQLISFPQRKTKTTRKLRITVNKYLSIHHLSVGLNTFTNLYWANDKKVQHFLSNFVTPSTNCYQIAYQRVIQQSNMRFTAKTTGALTLSDKTAPKSKKTLSDFLKQPSCDSTVKSTIYDFIAKKNTVIANPFDETGKLPETIKCDKKFSDFIVRPNANDKDWQYFLRSFETIDLDATKKMKKTAAEPKQALEVNCYENIYQPIWNCQTDGAGLDMNENEENVYETITIGSNNDSDLDKWVVADEFAFGHSLSESSSKDHSENVSNAVDGKNVEKLYTTVCILFDAKDSSLNRFVYQSMDTHMVYQDEQKTKENNESFRRNINQHPRKPYLVGWHSTHSANLIDDWKYLLKNPLYCEDEEDVVVTDVIMKKSRSTSALNSIDGYQQKPTSPTQIPVFKANLNDYKVSKIVSPKSIKDYKYDLASNKSTIENFKPSEIVGTDNLSGIYKRYDTDHQSDESLGTENNGVFKLIKKERKRDKLKGFIPKIKDEESGKGVTLPADGEKELGILFGVDLEKVEKHSIHTNIPKFVVDCITIISECDKIRTQGLYRASGNKTMIEKLKKQLNSPKQLRKHAPDSQFKRMQENDVHTLTGLLKLFFRELKSPLIPTEILDACTKDNVTDINAMAKYIKRIDDPFRSTLAYLMQHLKHVHKHSEENMMNSSNLSIIWGACIFASTVNEMNCVDNNDIKRINNFVCDLIDNFDVIFQNENQKNSQ